jgi:hypothetical protein
MVRFRPDIHRRMSDASAIGRILEFLHGARCLPRASWVMMTADEIAVLSPVPA